MAKFINAFTWNQPPNEEFASLRPAQAAKARELMEQGIIQCLFLAADNSGGWAIYNRESREDVLVILEQLPLRKYMNNNVKELQNVFSAADTAGRDTRNS